MNTLVQGESIYAKRILNFEEACQLTGLKPSYMRKLCMWNIIPFSKPNGKLLRFDRLLLEKWMLSNPNETLQQRQTAAVIKTTIPRTHRTKEKN